MTAVLRRLRHKSTTRPKRNLAKLARMARHLGSAETEPHKILDVGPGMAIKYVGRLSQIRKPFELFRRIEAGLRAILPLPRQAYEIYETGELISTFETVTGKAPEVTILDFDETVLATAEAQYGKAIDALILADLSVYPNETLTPFAGSFDAIFASAVVKRIPGREARMNAVRNLIALGKPGALMIQSDPEYLEAGCVPLPDCRALCVASAPLRDSSLSGHEIRHAS